MVKHIILWTLNPELSDAEKAEVKKGIKAGKYTIKVNVKAKGTGAYKAKSKTVKVTLTVKK